MKKKVFAISLPHHPFSSFRPLPMQLLVLVMSVPSFPFRKCLLKLSCLSRQLSLGLSAESLLLCLLPMTHSAPLYNFTHILIYFFPRLWFSHSLLQAWVKELYWGGSLHSLKHHVDIIIVLI